MGFDDRGATAGKERPGPGRQLASPVAFEFGAVFTPVLTVPLGGPGDPPLYVSDLLPLDSGRVWVADARAAMLAIYSQDGQQLSRLERGSTNIRCPISLTTLHGRWVAALDGHLPAVVILDEVGRKVRRFPLPELDRPVQICNLNDRWFAVVGTGWGAGSGHLVHLYSTLGDHVESLFSEPRECGSSGRAYMASAGSAVYLTHTCIDSFAIYDVEARAVLAFANLNAASVRQRRDPDRPRMRLSGLFAAGCGPLIAQYASLDSTREFVYDLYALDGTPTALSVRSRERVVGVEGPFFYSLATLADGRNELRVWRLQLQRPEA